LTVRAVIDSTCLIALERIERIELIPKLFSPVFAPPVVIDEVGDAPDWLIAREVGNLTLLRALTAQLDLGESAVIAVSMELEGPVVILDDKKARRVARQMGLKVVGTVGLFLRAKEERLVSEVKPLLESLHQVGFRLSRDLEREALRLAGEENST
jgi:predicted nucleic acid-binding protein